MKILVIVFLFIQCYYIYGLRFGCPTDTDVINKLWPCKCSQTFERTNWNVVVVCKGFTDYKKLQTSLTALKGYSITELNLFKVNLQYLPNDVFGINTQTNTLSVEIEKVTIQSSTIGDIAEPTTTTNSKSTFFSGLGPSMRELRIESSHKVAQFDWSRLVDSLQTPPYEIALKNILFYNNDMPTLPSSFDALGDRSRGMHPEKVILQWNGIATIEASLLANEQVSFQSMKVLDLSWNKLETLGNLFKGLPSNDAVNGISIETIILKNNKLTILGENDPFWKYLKDPIHRPYLSYIDLRENPIDCKCANIGKIKSNLSPITIDGKCSTPSQVFGKTLDNCSNDR